MEISRTANRRRGWILRRGLWLVAIVPFVVSCGGSASSGNKGALKLRIDETYVANVPENEQLALREANSDLYQARREVARARAAKERVVADVTIAKFENEQAVLARRAAEVSLRAAQKRAYLPEIRQSEMAMAIAVARAKAAKAKLRHRRVSLVHWKEEVRYRTSHAYAMEAKYELEKALLAQRHQIQPMGFSVDRFQQQYHQRMALAKALEIRARERRLEADSAHMSWLTLGRQADAVERSNRGLPPQRAPAPVPLAPEPSPVLEPSESEPPPELEPSESDPPPESEPEPTPDPPEPVFVPGPAFESNENRWPE